MKHYKNSWQKLYDLLSICDGTRSITYLMYDGRFSYTQVSDYLDYCMDKQLVMINSREKYVSTERGKVVENMLLALKRILE